MKRAELTYLWVIVLLAGLVLLEAILGFGFADDIAQKIYVVFASCLAAYYFVQGLRIVNKASVTVVFKKFFYFSFPLFFLALYLIEYFLL